MCVGGMGILIKYRFLFICIVERTVSGSVSNSHFLVLLVFKGLGWRRGSMDVGSLGSVRNEDRIGSAGYMEQDQFLQDIRPFTFFPVTCVWNCALHCGLWSVHSHTLRRCCSLVGWSQQEQAGK